VLVAPVCLALIIAIRIESPGSPLFLQRRIGQNQRPFTMLKLRTMHAGTPDRASHEVSPARITALGALLRRLKLDELPQLWNVLVGDMGLVGPRPCLPCQAELVAERSLRGLFAIRPGVTGPAQLAGIDMSEPRRLADVEAEYFSRSRTIWNDVELLVRTLAGGGRGDAVTTESAVMRPKGPEGD
jgi:lipopolysaccharide/colanic/teichoic acid biosynthesis glycosyltransferase